MQYHVTVLLVLTSTIICSKNLMPQNRPILDRFDTNKNGKLDPEERKAARKLLQRLRNMNQDQPEPVEATINPETSKLYGIQKGTFEVVSKPSFKIEDIDRKKSIPLRVTFPKVEGTYPLILHSHGALGSKNGYLPLTEHWASHGYIVIQPTHEDSITLLSNQEQLSIKSIESYLRNSRVLSQWSSRPLDLKFLMDSKEELERLVPKLKGKMDFDRIGISGHSFGAHTSMMIAGMKLFQLGFEKQIDDPRPKAFVFISPQGLGQSIQEKSFTEMIRPSLYITGDNDGTPLGDGKGDWRKIVYDLAPKGKKRLLWIDDAWHGFGGISSDYRSPSAGPDRPDHVNIMRSVTTAYWDWQLKDDADAKAFLNNEQFRLMTNNQAKLIKD